MLFQSDNEPSKRIMLRSRWLPCFCFLLAIGRVSDSPASVPERPDPRPNIIFILADDIGPTQLGTYGGPHRTPHLDAFAREGMTFHRAYAAAAVSSPIRAAIMTGKHPARLQITDFIPGSAFTDAPLTQPDWQKFLPGEEVTLGEAFQALGYRTAHFGTWHLSIEKKPPESFPSHPDKQGFDEYLVTYKPDRDTNPVRDPSNGDAITDRAIEFMTDHRAGPFFLFVSYNSIHDSMMGSRDRVARFEEQRPPKARDVSPGIAAMVENLDEGVGRLLAAVDDLGLRENTLVVFTGGDGGRHTYAVQRPFRAGKGWLDEGELRQPLLMRLPGAIAAGSNSDLLVSRIDFYPTLLDAVASAPDHAIDGVSFWPEVSGAADLPDRTLFWHYPHYHRGSGMNPASAMRRGDLKLIEWHEPLLRHEPGAYELYDLSADVGETVNIAAEHPDMLEAMQRELAAWKQSVRAQMPVLRWERETAVYDRATDDHPFEVFMTDGGWCWFQDPRAILHDDHLFVGSVKGTGDGEAMVGVYDLEARQKLGNAVMHPQFDRDDHNSPVFYVRPDGGVLAVYARHGQDRLHHSRISDPANPLRWSNEMRHERRLSNPRDRVTYMNLYRLEAEDQLYLFFRGIDYNPTFVTSTDHGKTWSEPVHFIQSELDGRHRPYPRYESNGTDTIYVTFTDGHPRKFGNSIYYAAFRNGSFHRADGSLIKNLVADGPLMPSEAELIYQGSGRGERGRYLSAIDAAWTSSIAVDPSGYPHIGYSVYLSNHDNRYRLASWDGTRWVDREVAFAGHGLYAREPSYTGLITMDPRDPAEVVISTNVDPATGAYAGGPHEIYRARFGLNDDRSTVKWRPVTQNSPVPNLRPMVVRDDERRIILWNRGDFRTYVNYDLDSVGLVETVSR